MAEHMVWRRLGNAGLQRLGSGPVFRLSRGHVYVNAALPSPKSWARFLPFS
jgi:hypothetical protein